MTLQQYTEKAREQLKNDCQVIDYYDELNVYQLIYSNGGFVLLIRKKLAGERLTYIQNIYDKKIHFDSISGFWDMLTDIPNWFSIFNVIHNKGERPDYAGILAYNLITYFNLLRKEHSFSQLEYYAIANWEKRIWNEAIEPLEFKQYCSCCKAEIKFDGNTPKIICEDCRKKTIVDKEGNIIEFFNIDYYGGLSIVYKNEYGKTIRIDNEKKLFHCYLDNQLYFATDGRLGGIVIQKMRDEYDLPLH